jgi:hypothetical protein
MLEEALDEQTDLATANGGGRTRPLSQAGPPTVASAEQPAVAEAMAPITTLPNLYGRWIFENPLGGQVLDFTPQGFFAQWPAIVGPVAGSWLFNPGSMSSSSRGSSRRQACSSSRRLSFRASKRMRT